MHQSSNSEQAMQSCLEACELCHRICLQTAMNHCLENGGKHVKAKHIRLMMNCAEICRTTANFQLTGSHFLLRLHELCAEICEACAKECAEIGDMKDSVAACLQCADSCRQMLSAQY
ncbi:MULTISPECIES: four-helix bundle copper-binding protein [unclassified Methylomonas]|uniref:four-helix bundle copper-binding protein n=1 Tax=unclassified Methylomonas TaxID=2608980 RepID=UPI0008DAB3B2|nr:MULTISPECIES: four-helix bundle copper-binding protein [unclassified Methylomonas]NJA06252.1 four-helix bundle copper-binding protein [Methylococcaceae bacterium WWC4]OHX36590.1 four-helix bundle copper-binding protein [Methylomonas sp. LWB]WGS88215.1 four-helix bundle copper-binding protein [Methylomonas sp. UP202]